MNPISQWIRLAEELGAARGEFQPCSVLFFLDGIEVRGVRLNLEGQALMNELADYQPCTLQEWQQLSALADLDHLRGLVEQMAEIGLVAWEVS